jgi:hypothetical protein
MDQTGHPGNEFCRIVDCGGLGAASTRYDIEADAGELEALALRFGLARLDRLSANASVKRTKDRRFAVAGSLLADLAQYCVVSLEPVPEHIEESFSLVYALELDPGDGTGAETEPAEGAGAGDIAFTLDDDDWPEPLLDGKIDIGEAVAQQLALALQPYPRASGVALEYEGIGGPADEAKVNPFAVLAGSKKGL